MGDEREGLDTLFDPIAIAESALKFAEPGSRMAILARAVEQLTQELRERDEAEVDGLGRSGVWWKEKYVELKAERDALIGDAKEADHARELAEAEVEKLREALSRISQADDSPDARWSAEIARAALAEKEQTGRARD